MNSQPLSKSDLGDDQLDSAPAMTKQQRQFTSSGLAEYRKFVVGDGSLLSLAYYEFCTLLFSGLSGLPGYGLRSVFYRKLFAKAGAKLAIGRDVVLRNPGAVSIGKKLLLDDFAALDVRGAQAAIELGDFVSIGRHTTLAAKEGKISLADGVNIGSYCRVATQSKIEIGESTLVAAYSYIGPGNHQPASSDTPLIAQEMEIKGGVKIGSHCWIGARATILDGVTVGDGAIIGAHSLVKDSVPAGAIAVGCPAKVVAHVP